MKNFAKQLKLAAVLLIAVLMVVGMTFAVSAETADESDAIDLSGITWVLKGTQKAPNRLVYNGREYTVEPINLPEGVTLVEGSEKNCSATNAGDYTATAKVQYTVDGVEKTETIAYTWTIARASYSIRGVKFNDGTLVYNGQPQMLEITGKLPEGVSVSYSLEKPATEAVNVGEYTAIAIVNHGFNLYIVLGVVLKVVLCYIKLDIDLAGINVGATVTI